MANVTITTDIRAGARLSIGMAIYRSERKGVLPKLARFLGKHLKTKRLSDWGFEILPVIREDEFNRPIGIAIDENTILISGTLEMPTTVSKGYYL